MSATSSERQTLDAVLQSLWPNGSCPTRRVRLLPSADRPRLIVPERPRRAAATLAGALRERGSLTARLRTRALRMGFASGLAGFGPGSWVAVPEGGIDDELARQFGEPVTVAVHLGPPRANRKPVLAIARPDGSLLGFAKLGINSLSDALVRNETEALRRLATAALPGVVVPELLHSGTYGAHPLLVQSALPVAKSRPATADELRAAQVEVARAFGTTTTHLADATYLDALRARAVELPMLTERLMSVIDDLRHVHAELEVEFGCWHGDWRPVNVAALAGRTLVWDWERFTTDVPLGYDALHQSLAQATRSGTPPDQLPVALTKQAPQLLQPFGVAAGSVPVLTRLYLVELAVRYLGDDQAGAGARLGRIDEWLLPHLEKRTVQP